jgi:hypothetical protein
MFLEEAVRTHLAADATLAAQIASRIYPVTMPQGAALPALIYSKISSVPEYTHDGSSGGVESRLQISCLGTTYAQVKQLSVNVKKAMRPLEQTPAVVGGAGGLFVAGAFLENEIDIYESNDVEQLERFHIPLDYMIQHEEDF